MSLYLLRIVADSVASFLNWYAIVSFAAQSELKFNHVEAFPYNSTPRTHHSRWGNPSVLLTCNKVERFNEISFWRLIKSSTHFQFGEIVKSLKIFLPQIWNCVKERDARSFHQHPPTNPTSQIEVLLIHSRFHNFNFTKTCQLLVPVLFCWIFSTF